MPRTTTLRPLLPTLAAAAGLAALGAAGCGGKGAPAPSHVIQNKGSDTMVNVAQVWAEAYRKAAPDVAVEVSGGGSGVGIAALVKGAVDIANASRDIKPSEVEAVVANTGKTPSDFKVGYDALAVFVHRSNPLEEVTLAQLKEIYAAGGRALRWSDLGVTIPGARDDRIVRVSRQSSSGTYEFFRDKALEKEDFRLGSLDLNGSKEVVELVAVTPTAIGYSGMGYATDEVKMLRVSPKEGVPAVGPTVEAVHGKTYPLARSLHLYTLGEPEGAVKAYVDWILSPAGQEVVKEAGYVPAIAAEAPAPGAGPAPAPAPAGEAPR